MRYLILFALLLAGCSNVENFKVGDCFESPLDGREPGAIWKVTIVGKYGYEVIGSDGSKARTSWLGKHNQVDCFDIFK